MIYRSILILDFGSQYNQLITRRIREMEVYAELLPYNTSLKKILSYLPCGIILSGGPSSVNEENSFMISKSLFKQGIPILGICYGMQIIAHIFKGKVSRAKQAEYGSSNFIIDDFQNPLLKGLPKKSNVWMSHFDEVNIIPKNFNVIGHTNVCNAALSNEYNKIYAVQFHPEVSHTEYGNQILKNFIFDICNCKKNWKIKNFCQNSINSIKKKVGNKKVILGLSGGIDSSVVSILIHKAIGKKLNCIFIDTGFLRKDESKKIMDIYKKYFHMNIHMIDASKQFISSLEGISDPEIKRKIIGKEFIKIFNQEALKIKEAKFLAQGTIYPDVIESISLKNISSIIKSHHNVGGLPKKMSLQLIEPLRYLFKDEVRKLAIILGLPKEIIYRHPFPGPGLAIRILGKISKEKINILQKADQIFINELKNQKFYNQISQAFVILLPIKSVGIMGDKRSYSYVAVLRSIDTSDFMTAKFSRLPFKFLEKVSSKIINEVEGINRITYDISSKPPATIEWE